MRMRVNNARVSHAECVCWHNSTCVCVHERVCTHVRGGRVCDSTAAVVTGGTAGTMAVWGEDAGGMKAYEMRGGRRKSPVKGN